VKLVASRELFASYLDLTPLDGRSRGLVRCIFHEDGRPSLSIDLDGGVFNCFGCGAQGGRRRFAELVGEEPQRYRRESPLQEARRRSLQEARRQDAKAEEARPLFEIADYIRVRHSLASRARARVRQLGPDHPRVWNVLELAAVVERQALAVEAELDTILAAGRIAS
jgi:DNA primase